VEDGRPTEQLPEQTQEGCVPTYSYVCTVCDHRFDAQQSISEPALSRCPECDGALRKLFGAVGVVFKGSGFYRTDARAGNRRPGKPSRRSSESTSNSSTTATTSTAPSTSSSSAASA
jgi:putative FmdB family regulatory protein